MRTVSITYTGGLYVLRLLLDGEGLFSIAHGHVGDVAASVQRWLLEGKA